jgi:undecaprenyl-diphosphatase
MKKHKPKSGILATALLTAFLLWTVAVCRIDVRPIGPEGSSVGFGTWNRLFHDLTGVHLGLYTATDWLSLVPVACALGFGILGLFQWLRRKSLLKVDASLLVLGGFYLVVLAAYLFFERCVINHRPVLIEGILESSYPSSTTMLVLCVIPTAVHQLRNRIRHPLAKRLVIYVLMAFAAFMVIGRLLSGVHWLSDIIGGILFSGGLVMLYWAVLDLKS